MITINNFELSTIFAPYLDLNSTVFLIGQDCSEVHFRQLIHWWLLIISLSDTVIFIGHTLSHFLQLIQLDGVLLILNIRNLLVIPRTAPYGQAYLHHGRSMNNEPTIVAPKIINAVIATSPVKKLNKA